MRATVSPWSARAGGITTLKTTIAPADDDDGQGVAPSPQGSRISTAAQRPLPRGRFVADGDDVSPAFRGVAHFPRKKRSEMSESAR